MCGIFGYFDLQGRSLTGSALQNMGDVINYRGPDGQGIFVEPGLALGNQRLAILDIEHGQQPFISDDKQIVVVQNGEIFNHVELADELKNTEFECKTHCDTEVLLRLYQKHGIDFVSKLNGMFAIAIWDNNDKALYLIRDRVGEKPLHFHYVDDRLIFGSEIKSILAAGIDKQLDHNALDSFLSFNYVVPPSTLFKDVKHVMPGTYIKATAQGIEDVRWWDLASIALQEKPERQWINEFNDILDDAVRIRLRADVPFGAFLSGGVDSSCVVGLMSKHMNQSVKTFTIGFHDEKFDESPFAELAATRFSTEHVLEKVEANLLDLWPKATYHCDQPHGDVSFLPTYRVAELASSKVKMVLTGDGADELFAGYDKYKSFFADDYASGMSETEFRGNYLDNISLFKSDAKSALYSEGFKQQVAEDNTASYIFPLFDKSQHMGRVNQALYIDTMLLLPGNNLVKPDRMGMAVSIENRAPFLDFRMVELAFSMPGKLKLQQGETKYIYKKAVADLIGSDLTYRKKQMFTVPISEWLKHDLKEMVLDLLLSEKTMARELFNEEYVSTLYADHCNGSANNTREIRALMALEIWFREFDV
ncbi:asparagine synthase (glutamine-hydrolyzing) [Moritella sp. 24]|uniref:asparagine synthase (glutamine-hydrolyzing) n=1 Tax=Moritella sp. 24 TaxID=2746230 RepID=UPI001BAAA0E4|nr:asparagine synthase (glutamine-hydrolyzing) [Moritella sp. 24]QUM77867.1 asparagine synthase (glutamine-hydrolyzing) [Moritella sp. 24]